MQTETKSHSPRGAYKRRLRFLEGLEGLDPQDVADLTTALSERGRMVDTPQGPQLRPAVNLFLDGLSGGDADRQAQRKTTAQAVKRAGGPGRKVARKAKAANPGKSLKGGGKARSARVKRSYD